MASQGDEDLVASKTDGFKVGEKKTVEEYAKLGIPLPHPISFFEGHPLIPLLLLYRPE